jgi:hypothetical protein
MSTFLHLGNCIINADHIVMAEWFEAEAEREANSYEPSAKYVDSSACGDEYIPGHYIMPAKPRRVVLTLTSKTATWTSETSAVDTSECVTITDEQADKLWLWLENRADIVNLETVQP